MFEMIANRNSYMANSHEDSHSIYIMLEKKADRLMLSLLEPEINLTKRDRKISADNEDDNIAKTMQLMKNKRIAKAKKENEDNIEQDNAEGEVTRFNGRAYERRRQGSAGRRGNFR